MMAVIIIPPRIIRQAIRTLTMTTDRLMKEQQYAAAFAITTLTVRVTTAAQFTATGIDLRRALG